jgi:hypothetical protein
MIIFQCHSFAKALDTSRVSSHGHESGREVREEGVLVKGNFYLAMGSDAGHVWPSVDLPSVHNLRILSFGRVLKGTKGGGHEGGGEAGSSPRGRPAKR